MKNTKHQLYKAALAFVTFFFFSVLGVWGQFQMATGTYTGTGVDNALISGVGFQPDIVIVKSETTTNEAQIRISSMPDGYSKQLVGGAELYTNRIKSFSIDGFILGNNNDVNYIGKKYYWTAFKSGSLLHVGSYVGNGAGARQITGIGFQPEFLILIPTSANRATWKSSSFNSNKASSFGADFSLSNTIESLDADGFTVGSDPKANKSASPYYYAAFKANPGTLKVGSYMGDGLNGKVINGVGFQAKYMFIKASSSSNACQKSTIMPDSASIEFNGSRIDDNRIYGIFSDGFVLGIQGQVNTRNLPYHYVCLAGQCNSVISITKVVEGSVPVSAWTYTSDIPGYATFSIPKEGGTINLSNVPAGDYTIVEDTKDIPGSVPVRQYVTTNTCGSDNQADISLASCSSVECVFTSSCQPSLTIYNQFNNTNPLLDPSSDWEFTIEPPIDGLNTFTLPVGGGDISFTGLMLDTTYVITQILKEDPNCVQGGDYEVSNTYGAGNQVRITLHDCTDTAFTFYNAPSDCSRCDLQVTISAPSRCSNGDEVTIEALTIPADGSYSYAWTVPDGVADPGDVASFGATEPGEYSVTVSDGAFCSVDTFATLTILQAPEVSVNDGERCSSGDPVHLTATVDTDEPGDHDYIWTVPDGEFDPGNVADFDATVAGTYSVIVTNLETGCSSDPASGELTVKNDPVVSVNSPIRCVNVDEVTIEATAEPSDDSYSYVWTVPDGVTDPGDVASFSATDPGDYSVIITGTGNCTASATGTLTVYELPQITVNSGLRCYSGDSVQIAATIEADEAGDHDFSWTVPDGEPDPGNVQDFHAFSGGTYSVVVTNTETGCISESASGELTITEDPSISVNSPSRCINGDEVTIEAEVGPEDVSFTYVWDVPEGVENPGDVSSFTATEPGAYGVTIYDASNCSASDTAFVTVFELPEVFVDNTQRCASGDPAFIVATVASVEAGDHELVWTVPDGEADPGNVTEFFANEAGIYSVVATNIETGCSSDPGYGELIILPEPSVSVNSPSRCVKGEAVTMEASVDPLDDSYTYLWSVPDSVTNPGNVPSFLATVAGDYTVTIIDSNNCSVSASGALTVNQGPVVTVNDGQRCTTGDPVHIAATIESDESGDHDYVWIVPDGEADPGNVAEFDATTAGIYSVIVTNLETGCFSDTASGEITIAGDPSVSVNSPSRCADGDDVTIEATPDPSGSNYTYVWTVPDGVADPGDVASFSASEAGDYSVTISDEGGCTASATGTLSVNQLPVVSVNDATRCSLGDSVEIAATIESDETGDHDYVWTVPSAATDPGNVDAFDASEAGTYSVIVTNTETGCSSASASGELTVNENPSVTVNSPSRCADGDDVAIEATPDPSDGNYTYVWTVPDGVADPGDVSSFSASDAGDYSVTITDEASCTASATGTLTVNQLPVVSVNDATRCSAGDPVQVAATIESDEAGGHDYVWTVPSAATDPGNVDAFDATEAGIYSVIVTNTETGCTSESASGELTVNENPSVTVNSPSRCADGDDVTIEATADPLSGTYSYIWTVPDGVTDPGDVASFSASEAGDYSVTITDEASCTASATGTLTVNQLPVVSVNDATRCSLGDPVQIAATIESDEAGGHDYVWTVPSAATDPGNVDAFDATEAGTYSVIVTNTETGCTSQSASGELTVNESPSVTVNSPSRCADGDDVTIEATPDPSAGNYTYAWVVPDGVADPGDVASFSASEAGDYSVTITDEFSCTATSTGTLTVNQLPVVSVNDASRCSSGDPIQIAATIESDEAGDHDYVWTVPTGEADPGNVDAFDASEAGTYSVVVTNTETGCVSESASGELTINEDPSVSVNSPARCTNGGAVTIEATPELSEVTYTYSWTVPDGVTDPGNVSSFDATEPGDYSVTITDDGNCTGSATGTLTVNQLPVVSVNDASRCSSGDPVQIAGTIGWDEPGGHDYVWIIPDGEDDPGNVSEFDATTAGIYSLIVTNSETGCTSDTASGLLTVNAEPSVTVNSPSRCSGGDDVTIEATVDPAGGIYSYSWTAPDGVADPGDVASFSASDVGTYTVIVTDTETGCSSDSASGELSITEDPVVSVNSPARCTNGGAVTIEATPELSEVTYTYSWTVPDGVTDPGNVSSFDATEPGDYSVTITDDGNCTGSGTGTLTINQIPVVSVNDASRCSSGDPVQIAGTIGWDEPGGHDYVWIVPDGESDPGNVSEFDATTAGIYSLIVINIETGCSSDTASGELTISGDPSVSVNSPSRCANGDEVTIEATPDPSDVTYTYEWTVPDGVSDPGNVASFSASEAGEYSVTITNEGNCTATASGTLTVNQIPVASVIDASRCSSGDPALISATIESDEEGSHDYVWIVPESESDPGNVSEFDAYTAGTYYLIVTNNETGCTSDTASGELSLNENPTVTVNSPTRCAAGDPVTIEATPDPSDATYSYIWTVPDGETDPGDVASFSASTAGDYSVTITNESNCTAEATGTLIVYQSPEISVDDAQRCTSGDPAHIMVNIISDESGDYDYAWTVPPAETDPGSVAEFDAYEAGTYSVIVTNTTTGCVSESASGELTVNPDPTVSVNSATRCANGDAVTIEATPDPSDASYSYVWTVPDGESDPGDVASFDVSTAGDYSVTVTDAGNCTASATGTVTVTPIPEVLVNYPQRCTSGDQVQIMVEVLSDEPGDHDYVWTVPPPEADPGNVADFYASEAGIYSVIVTNTTTGCSSEFSSGELIVNPDPTVTVNSPTRCVDGDKVDVIATPDPADGNYDYVWTVPDSESDPGNTSIFGALTEGDYTVTITDLATGCTGSGTGTLTVVTGIYVSVNSESRCENGDPVTITASVDPPGTYDYVWTVPDGASDPGNVESFSADVAGSYSVLVTVPGSTCTSEGYGELFVYPVPVVSVNSETRCSTGDPVIIAADASPADAVYTYVWTVPDGVDNPGNVPSFFADQEGNYDVVVTDEHLCTASASGSVTVLEGPTVTCSVDNFNQTITAVVTGGSAPYDYAWDTDPPQYDQTVRVSDQEYYTVVVTDANGCTGTTACSVNTCNGFFTASQGSWGSSPKGNSPANFLKRNFSIAFPAPNYLTVGCLAGGRLRLTTARAVDVFLPSNSNPRVLPSGLLVNPTQTYKNVFAGNVIALTLNVQFDLVFPTFSSSNTNFRDLIVNTGTFAGWSVGEFLNMANDLLGGCSTQYDINEVNQLIGRINSNYNDGNKNNGLLVCPGNYSPPVATAGRAAASQNNDNVSANGSNPEIQIYPNPFTQSANIRFRADCDCSKAQVDIFDVAGAKIAELFNGPVKTGETYTAVLNKPGLQAGLYYYRITLGNKVINGKLLKTK